MCNFPPDCQEVFCYFTQQILIKRLPCDTAVSQVQGPELPWARPPSPTARTDSEPSLGVVLNGSCDGDSEVREGYHEERGTVTWLVLGSDRAPGRQVFLKVLRHLLGGCVSAWSPVLGSGRY